MIEEELIKVHNFLLEYFLKYKNKHPEFTFLTRMQNNQGRLEKGYLFQGNENYIFVPLYRIGDSNNKTKTIGFVFTETRQYIEIVFNKIEGATDKDISFHEELVEYLKSINTFKIEPKNKRQYFFVFKENNLKINLDFFLDSLYTKSYELLKKYGLLDRYVIDDEKFNRNINRINEMKNKRQLRDNEMMSTQINNIKNIILYGSPGVGKTHNTSKLINLIENGVSEKEIFETIKNNEKNDGVDIDSLKERIKFVTFHQSFGYEDFIEGFRPNEEGNIELEKGIFSKICKEAEENLLKSGEVVVMPFSDAFNTLFKEKIENEESVTIDLKRAGSYFNVNNYNDKTIYFEKQSGTTKHTLSIASLEKMYNEEKNSSINGGLAVYYEPILEKLLEIKRKSIVDKIDRKNYYLVIDEINRGNISKIFGELITLIEEDKRDTLEVTLPYSKKAFKIPSNLYIIGTMNSTDKSIALIDIALRRRFTFLKMTPNPALVTGMARDLFISLNERITQDLGEDYVIGHSYFMNIDSQDDLDFTLEYKIIPLLEEYYYGDERCKEVVKLCKQDNIMDDDE